MLKRRLTAAIVPLVWLFTAAFSPQVQSGPIIWRQTIRDSVTVDYCGFPMQINTTGTGIFHLWQDSNGKLQRLLITQANMKMSFTNLNTGKSAWSPTVNMTQARMNRDGTMTQTFRGLVWHIVVPGQGLVSANVGHIDWLITFDSQGYPTSSSVVFKAGMQNGSLSQTLCNVLK